MPGLFIGFRTWSAQQVFAVQVGDGVGIVFGHRQERKLQVVVGGGYTPAVSDLRDSVADGFNFNLGLLFNVTDTFGIETEYSFNGLGQKQLTIPVSPTPVDSATPAEFFAETNLHVVGVNIVVTPYRGGRAAPYLIAGGGVYHRPITITTPTVGYVPGYCNPYWYICVPGEAVPVNTVIGNRSATNVGVDVGGGMSFAFGENATMYMEVRYHYVRGPEVTNSVTGESLRANGKFLPITVGFRF